MRNWQQIPIPQLMLDHCERDPRGLPVPFVIFKDKDGKHHFKINDSEKSIICLCNSKCSICGQYVKLNERWLVGGIASALDPNGYYIDLPVHKECGQYALQVCPYLAIRNYNGKIDMTKLQEQFKGETVLHNPTVDQDRLPLFVFGRPNSVQYVGQINDFKVVPERPFLEMEFWDEGKRITDLTIIENKLVGTKWEKYLNQIQNYFYDIQENNKV